MRVGLAFPNEEPDVVRLTKALKDDVLEEMVLELAVRGKIRKETVQSIVVQLKDREELGSTDIGGGIALPHARHDQISESFIIFGVSEMGVEWGGMSGVCTIVAMTLSSTDKNDQGFKMLAPIADRIRDERFLKYLKRRFSSD